jgi:hypothetical protein
VDEGYTSRTLTQGSTVTSLHSLPAIGRFSLPLFVLVLASCAVAPQAGQPLFHPEVVFEPRGEEFPDLQMGRMPQWYQALEEGGEVVIDNPYGDVYVRHNRGGRRVGISGVVQRLGADPEIEQLQLTASPQSVVFRVRYPGDGRRRPMTASGRPGRVDLSVLVPDRSTLHIRTRDGLASGKRVQANLVVDTESGDIDFSTSGWIRARTDSGRIAVVLAGEQWREPVALESVAGAIELELPSRIGASIAIETGGRVIADPAELVAQLVGADGRWTVVWGTPVDDINQIRINSRNGDVRVTLYGMEGDLPKR